MSLMSGFELSLPQWLPDETVFSWASRYHKLAGHRLPAQTCQALFGDRRHGSQHDFPTRLERFVDQTAGQLGTPENVVLDHTLLRYYLVPRGQGEVTAAISSLVQPTSGVLKFRLGILTSRFRANHPLKACPRCMGADERARGSSYWHLTHQFPGAWMCRRHDTPLQVSTVKANGVDRFGWVLPHDAGLIDIVSTSSVVALRRFADFVAGWSSLQTGSLTPRGIADACHLHLSGGAARQARVSRAEAGVGFAEAIAELRQVPELHGLPGSWKQAKSDLDRWVFAPRGGTHPLRHLAIIYWLFPKWEDFLATYAAVQAAGEPGEQRATDDGQADVRKAQFVVALKAGRSVTAASRLVGVTVGTGIAWAAQHGVRANRRPKSITASLQKCIADDLGRGDEKPDIARRHGVSVQIVTRVLRSEVGLAELRHVAQLERARVVARQAWTGALGAWPGATVAYLRIHAGAAYAWLRRHDRDWLDWNLPQRLQRSSAAPRVDWDRRDLELAATVRRVAADLVTTSADTRLRPWQIYQAVPELKAKLGALARLPLTARALDEVTRRVRRGRQKSLL